MNLKRFPVFFSWLAWAGALRLCAQSITSFSPGAGAPGDTITLTGSGFYNYGPVTVQFWNKKTVTSGYINSDSQMTVVVPNGASTGPLSIIRAGQTNFSSYDFTVVGPGPFITGFSPGYGDTNNTQPISINGVHFLNASRVAFNGTAASFTVANSAGTLITAYLPYGAATGPISVTTPYGTSNSPTAFVVVGAGPYVAGFSPASGNAGDAVTLTGLHFTGMTNVQFGGVNAGFIPPTSDTSLTAYVPAGAMSGPIRVATTSGAFTSRQSFFLLPQVTGFSPPSAPTGGAVTLVGRNFTNAFAVTFNGLPAVFSLNSNTQLTTQVPAGATTGPIRVSAPAGQSPPSDVFVVLPSISGFTPAVGAAGTNVTVSGQNLLGATGVAFGGVAGTLRSVTYTQLVATVPAGALTGPVTVTTTNGTASSVTNFYVPAAIAGFSPTNGAAGATVEITGANLTGATEVTFGGLPADFVVTNNSTIGAVVPAGVSTGPIAVTTPAGTVSSGNRLFYAPPVINSFIPVHGLPGTNVTVFGNNFLGATAVSFNGATASFSPPTNNLSLQAVVPAGATTGPIAITTPGGTAVSSLPFTLDYAADLAVSASAAPDPVYVGSNLTYTVTVTNAGPFAAPDAVLSNTLPAAVQLVSATNTLGTLGTNGNSLVVSLGTFGISSTATLRLVVKPLAAGTLTNFAAVSSGYPDPTPFNDTNALATTVIPVPPPPPPLPEARLTVEPYAPSLLLISWPAALTNYSLQFAPALGTNAWSNVLTAPLVSGTNNVVIQPEGEPARFFRLKQ